MRKRTRRTRTRKRKKRKRKTLTFILGLLWGPHSTPDLTEMEAPRTQVSAGPDDPCQSSQPQSSAGRVGNYPR